MWVLLPRDKAGAGIEYAVYFLPRRTIACERIFQEQGVYGDIVAGELPISFIPFDNDVLSLEMGSAFRVSYHPLTTSGPPCSTISIPSTTQEA